MAHSGNEDWKTRAIVIGGVVGALAGLGAAYLFIRNAEQSDEPPEIGTSEMVTLGLLVLGTLRQVAALGQPDK